MAVVYHGNCNDGTASAWAAWKILGPEAEYIAWRYGDPVPQVDGMVVFVVDISPKPEEVEQLRASAKAVVIVDHHDSSLRKISDLPRVDKYTDFMKIVDRYDGIEAPVYLMMDTERSGAILSWLFFNDHGLEYTGPVPTALTLIDDYDRFTKKYPETAAFNAWLAGSGRYIDNFDRHVNEDGTPKYTALSAGKLLVKQLQRQVNDIIRNYVRRVEWRGYKVALVNAPFTIRNEVADELNQTTDVDFVLVYSIRSDKVVFSARGKDKKINLSILAEEFGGGGHEDAAAFSIPLDNTSLMFALGIAKTITF